MRRMHWGNILVIGVLLVLVLAGCGTSKRQLEQQVTASFQDKMNTDPQYNAYPHITVVSVTLVSSGKNTYNGMVTLEYKSRDYDIPITVTSDGKTMMWQTQPGAFLFLLQ